MKNEKFLLNIQTKCGNIANEILNAAIDAARTFKCKWPKEDLSPYSGITNMYRYLGSQENSACRKKHFNS